MPSSSFPFFPTASFLSLFPSYSHERSLVSIWLFDQLLLFQRHDQTKTYSLSGQRRQRRFFCFWLDSYSALSVNQFVCISLTFCLNWLVCLGVWGVMSCVMEPKYGVCGVQRLLAAHNLYSEGCWSTDVVEALNITNQNWFQLLTYLTKWASFRFIVILSSNHAWKPQGCVKFGK